MPHEIIKIFFINAAGAIAELCDLVEVIAHHAHLPDHFAQFRQFQTEHHFLQSEIPEENAGIRILCFFRPLLNLVTLLGGYIELDGMRALPYTDIISPLRPFGDCAGAVFEVFQKVFSAAF